MPQQAATQTAAPIISKAPVVINTGSSLTLALTLARANPSTDIQHVLILDATLDSKTRTTVTLPWYVGAISAEKAGALPLMFPLGGAGVGETHAIQIKGTCDVGGSTQPFSLVLSFTVPSVRPPLPFGSLAATIDATQDEAAGLWSYRLHNGEASPTNRYITGFQLSFRAPFVIRSTPPGWSAQTDNSTFVLWYVTDRHTHAQFGIPPGGETGSFQIQSGSKTSEGAIYTIASWDIKSDTVSLMISGTVLTPGHVE